VAGPIVGCLPIAVAGLLFGLTITRPPASFTAVSTSSSLRANLELRPVFHRLEGRVRAHVLLCWLALPRLGPGWR
jgi:hypothetical protein